MPPTLSDELGAYTTVNEVIVFPISTLSVMYFIYGFYVLLFGVCFYMMRRQGPDGEHLNASLYLWLATILFMLTTIFIVAYTMSQIYQTLVFFTAAKTGNYERLAQYLARDVEKTALLSLKQIVSVLLNITAECMLIHRCYLIWDSKKRVAIPLIIASILSNGLGIVCAITVTIGSRNLANQSNYKIFLVGDITSGAYNISSAVVNGVLTLLTAGRIWWIHRGVRAHGIHASDTFIQSVSRIILESGIIYPICIVATQIVTNTATPDVMPFDFFPLTVLSAGIAPTLIMVRARLGKNVENLQDMLSDIRFTSQASPREVTVRSQAQVYSIGIRSLSREPAENGGSEEQIVNGKADREITV
ncbi:hypothetical protein Moror_3793 [Moniliophthora roreri MCA 2997]|uniref:Uncharacterized protein n=1 Tax=Moniliophthora roreri (strain MCA 2997) TaxID=1381753 RepID=V2XXX3_MONRO|nr:hypothetical protein Moror_3793 [Moniliophthora roreri MCA 2997]